MTEPAYRLTLLSLVLATALPAYVPKSAILATITVANDYFMAKWPDTGKELSETALFVYGMAWGMNHGLLDRKTYLPIVAKPGRQWLPNVYARTGRWDMCRAPARSREMVSPSPTTVRPILRGMD